ncbi:MAG: hypothetical protein OXG46_01775 [Chloroflexi bacterium]|nr:hypothetical protein [Chloroflexota bacterium]MCY3937259.1 hypothetical protein [Chloroflexota bacterium]
MTESGGQAPKVGVVVSGSQPDLELFAASELCRYLADLFGVEASPSEHTEGFPDGFFLIGSPATNPAVAEAIGDGSSFDVSDQGIVIQRCQSRRGDALIVGGGSPRATLWAVYELVERWGVRYLLHGDILPERRAFKLPDMMTVMEPNLTIRQWRVVNDFACGPESWGIEDYKPVIDQLAKLKFNRVYAFIWPYHPFVHYEVRGVKRNSGTLWFGDRYPVDDDTIGREVFGDIEEFWNPDLPLGASYEETAAAGQRHIHNLFGYAASRGMECVIHTATTEFPSEFAGLLKNARETHQLGTTTVVPGDGVAIDDDVLTDLATAVIQATVNIYPEACYISFVMQEHRQWIEEHERAWQALDEKYGVEQVCSLESVLANAADRDMPAGSYPGGEPRPVLEVKGDIVSLYFLDRLIDDLDVLADTARPEIKVILESVARELFPVLNVIAKPGWQTHVGMDYFPSSSALRDSYGKAPQLDLPATAILTLHDDNVGILPQSTLGSLHRMTQRIRDRGWSGFSTRYWLIGDHDPTVSYIAKAGWDIAASPDEVCRYVLKAACGEACVEDMFEMHQEVERATVILEQNAFTIAFPAPNMIMKSWVAEPFPRQLAEVRQAYLNALDWARQARSKVGSGGGEYIDYWIGRLDFGIAYLDCIESLRNAALADSAGEGDEALRQTHAAVDHCRAGTKAYAAIVQDQSDIGAIAVMNEHVYRPLKAKVKELAGA